jgi:hypothetical protein
MMEQENAAHSGTVTFSAPHGMPDGPEIPEPFLTPFVAAEVHSKRTKVMLV